MSLKGVTGLSPHHTVINPLIESNAGAGAVLPNAGQEQTRQPAQDIAVGLTGLTCGSDWLKAAGLSDLTGVTGFKGVTGLTPNPSGAWAMLPNAGQEQTRKSAQDLAVGLTGLTCVPGCGCD